MHGRLNFRGDLSTTAMGIMPHEDVRKALDVALQMDIPFWPQLPRLSYYEDMYVQVMEMFPGVVIDEEHMRIFIDSGKFLHDLPQYLEREDDPGLYGFSTKFSRVYGHFLSLDLSAYRSVRGQVISPVSLSLKITDENGKPIVYNDEMRALIFSFIQKKVNVQYRELCLKNSNAFVWVDDPGLEFVFSAMCGYDHLKAKDELTAFFGGIEGPRGLHLCGRPDWDFLLSLNIDILSFNAYAFGDIFVTYDKVKTFLEKGNMISWGIVPTYYEEFSREDVKSLAERLENMWRHLVRNGLDMEIITGNSMLAPATCNLMNADKTATVERSFLLVNELSDYVKERYSI
jgi:hypothetical protein